MKNTSPQPSKNKSSNTSILRKASKVSTKRKKIKVKKYQKQNLLKNKIFLILTSIMMILKNILSLTKKRMIKKQIKEPSIKHQRLLMRNPPNSQLKQNRWKRGMMMG